MHSGPARSSSSSMWLSQNPSKRWTELFFLIYTPFWLILCLGIVVPLKLYEDFKELEYFILAFVSVAPSFLIPLVFVCKADKGIPLKDRYWVKFPYYEFVDRDAMYKFGSLFYAIYFIVSFPMFLRIEEKPGDKWDLPRVAVDALGACMLVTILLDLWRLYLGPTNPVPETKQCLQSSLPWFPENV